MKSLRCFAVVLLLAALITPVIAQDEEAFLPSAWDAYKEADTKTPSGAFYLGYVLGVLQGTNNNSLVLSHVPDDVSIAQMMQIVGEYIDKHRTEGSFKQLASHEIVIKAVLAKYPEPKPVKHEL